MRRLWAAREGRRVSGRGAAAGKAAATAGRVRSASAASFGSRFQQHQLVPLPLSPMLLLLLPLLLLLLPLLRSSGGECATCVRLRVLGAWRGEGGANGSKQARGAAPQVAGPRRKRERLFLVHTNSFTLLSCAIPSFIDLGTAGMDR
eukprot:364934-Chlamydomonas_euryale.AAC.4